MHALLRALPAAASAAQRIAPHHDLRRLDRAARRRRDARQPDPARRGPLASRSGWCAPRWAGWPRTDGSARTRSGRHSEYSLTRHGRERFAEATQRIYSEPPQDWDHQWTILLLPPAAGGRRNRIREEMLWLGFGQLAPGVLAHPSRSVEDTRQQLREMGVRTHPVVLQARSAGVAQDRQLILAGWDFAELERGYRRFVSGFAPVERILADGALPSPQCAFVLRALLIHEYRKIHLRDPLLPHDLLPREWIGVAAYDLCRGLYRRVFAAAEEYLSSNARPLDGPLASPSSGAAGRFAARGNRPSRRSIGGMGL